VNGEAFNQSAADLTLGKDPTTLPSRSQTVTGIVLEFLFSCLAALILARCSVEKWEPFFAALIFALVSGVRMLPKRDPAVGRIL